jgi:hypothetical protein
MIGSPSSLNQCESDSGNRATTQRIQQYTARRGNSNTAHTWTYNVHDGSTCAKTSHNTVIPQWLS